ncbi:MAG TPA: methyltransferase [Thermoanaerobaculia bacterium]|nr:methyltransferase [Thermoanaerobaculia bacterium]
MTTLAQDRSASTKRPPSDSPFYTLTDGFLVPLAGCLAWDLGLFEQLASGSATAAELAEALGLAERPVAVLASAAGCLGLLEREGARWQLSATSRAYLLSASAWSLAPTLELICGESPHREALALLERAVVGDQAVLLGGSEGGGWAAPLADDPVLARRFTAAMDAHSRPAATAWPATVPLAEHRRLLDLGGGAGTHALAALAACASLSAVVLDLPAVIACAASGGEAAQAPGAGRLHFEAGDFWYAPWPIADLHLFSDVFHDWPPAACQELARRSFAELPTRGRILVHELLLDEDHCGPWPVVASSVAMLLWSAGRQYSAGELEALLARAGFGEIETRRTFGCWGMVMGRKP